MHACMHVMFLQGSKPWRYTGKEENMDREDIKLLVKKWWEIYEDESLDYQNSNVITTAVIDEPEKLGSLVSTTTLSEDDDGVVNPQWTAPSAA